MLGKLPDMQRTCLGGDMHDPMHSFVTLFMALLSVLITVAPLSAAEPRRGTDYLKFIIDHHFSALRMTELAAGTDLKRCTDITGRGYVFVARRA